MDADGRPAARYVLLRGLDERGFCFYTNYDSAKGRELAAHPYAALTFGWLEIHRSVRIEGPGGAPGGGRERRLLRRAPARGAHQRVGVAAERGHRRPRRARAACGRRARRFADAEIPRPPHWGGFLVRPERIELWQGRAGRLHDRLRYVRDGDGWRIERLAPVGASGRRCAAAMWRRRAAARAVTSVAEYASRAVLYRQ